MEASTQKQVVTQKNEQNLTPAEEQRLKRIDDLVTYYFHDELNFKEACAKVGISRTTGYEYLKLYKQTEEPLKVNRKFWQLLAIVEETNPEKALDCITRYNIKLTDSNVNVKADVTEKVEGVINVNINQLLREYEAALTETDTQTQNLPTNNPAKPLDTPPTPP